MRKRCNINIRLNRLRMLRATLRVLLLGLIDVSNLEDLALNVGAVQVDESAACSSVILESDKAITKGSTRVLVRRNLT
jgi:hypothetical protein